LGTINQPDAANNGFRGTNLLNLDLRGISSATTFDVYLANATGAIILEWCS
ncbi:hypothetical protein LCGC14_2489980, partial [marine sediment metagenome]